MTTIPPPMFSFPLSGDEALVLRTPSITDAYHALLVANRERRAGGAVGHRPPGAGRDALVPWRPARGTGWRAWNCRWRSRCATGASPRLTGAVVSLHITPYSRSAEIGYWIDGGHEGRGLASRAVAAVLDHGFGALGIERVSLHTEPANERSRALARRLGFVEEGVLRQGLAFPGERRDEIVYGLLASEWSTPRA